MENGRNIRRNLICFIGIIGSRMKFIIPGYAALHLSHADIAIDMLISNGTEVIRNLQ